MDTNRVTRALSLTSLLLGVGSLLVVGYSIVTYQAPPDNGGTSISGLIWVIFMILGGLVMADGGIAALFLRYATPSRFTSRIIAAGLVASSTAGLCVAAFQSDWQGGFEILEMTPMTVGGTFILAVGGGGLVVLGISVQILGRYLG